jgi:hypothetical protein
MATIELLGKDAIEIDLRDYPAKVTRATMRALNRAIKSGQSVMTKAIAGDTGLKQKDVREALVLREAGGTHLVASLGASRKRLFLVDFNAKGPEPSRGRGRGITYRLSGGKGRVEDAFFATMKSGHRGVFKRTPGKFMQRQKSTWKHKRQAIHELHGPSIGQVFRKFRQAGLARVLDVFQKNFDHELEFVKSAGQADAD